MGTYIPFYFPASCGSPHCRGGWDCHPDLMHPEVERLYWCQRLPECCRWSIHHQFDALVAQMGRPPAKPPCHYGRDCYRKSPLHLLNYAHDETPVRG